MKIMVRIHDLGKNSPKELAHQAKEIGFDGAQLVLYKAIEGFSGKAHSINKDDLVSCAKAFKEENCEDYNCN
jgi:PII-like signaling protein